MEQTLLCDVSKVSSLLVLIPVHCVWKYNYYHGGAFFSSVMLLSMFSTLICIADAVFMWIYAPENVLGKVHSVNKYKVFTPPSRSEVHAVRKAFSPFSLHCCKALRLYRQVKSLFSPLCSCIFYSHVQGSYPCFACFVLFTTFCILQAALSLADIACALRCFHLLFEQVVLRNWLLCWRKAAFWIKEAKIRRTLPHEGNAVQKLTLNFFGRYGFSCGLGSKSEYNRLSL